MTLRYLKLSLFSSLLLSCCSACYPGYRECPCSYQDARKRFYSQALTEIVERVLYPSYLVGLPAENLPDAGDQQHLLNSNDSADHRVIWYNQQLAIAQNRLFQDTARFQTLYLDTTSQRAFTWAMNGFSQPSAADSDFWQCQLEEAGFHLPNMQAAIYSLHTLQRTLAPQDFQTCTFRVEIAKPHQNPDTAGTIGIIYLSQALFDAKRQHALLAFNYYCGHTCGFSQLLLFENSSNRWRVKRKHLMSIY